MSLHVVQHVKNVRPGEPKVGAAPRAPENSNVKITGAIPHSGRMLQMIPGEAVHVERDARRLRGIVVGWDHELERLS